MVSLEVDLDVLEEETEMMVGRLDHCCLQFFMESLAHADPLLADTFERDLRDVFRHDISSWGQTDHSTVESDCC